MGRQQQACFIAAIGVRSFVRVRVRGLVDLIMFGVFIRYSLVALLLKKA